MLFRSKWFWSGMLVCVGVLVFLGVIVYQAGQPQKTIKIYKAVTPAPRSDAAQLQDKSLNRDHHINNVDKDKNINETPVTDPEKVDIPAKQPLDSEKLLDENSVFPSTRTQSVSDVKAERLYGLTIAEMEKRIPMLEEEIRTNLTKAVELYTDLRKTDGMAGKSPEIAAWREKTWAEVKSLFHDVADTGKIMQYVSYLKAVGGKTDPILPGGWIFKLTESLPMQVTYVENPHNVSDRR